MNSRRDEHGFTIVEVMIAILIIGVVAVAATSLVGSSSQSSSRGKVIDREHGIVEGGMRKIVSDQSWQAGCRTAALAVPPQPCDISNFVAPGARIVEENGTVVHSIRAFAVGQDLASDLQGAADRDGIRPDTYQVTVQDTVTTPTTMGKVSAVSASSSIDATSRANTGSITVVACKVTNQVDERIGSGLCTNGGGTYPIAGPESNYAGNLDWLAWSSAKSNAAYTSMTVARVGSYPLSIKGPIGSDSKRTIAITTSVTGDVLVRDLEPGDYQIVSAPPAGTDVWSSHTVPSGGRLTVVAGEVSDAVLMFAPAASAPVKVTAITSDITDPRAVRDYFGSLYAFSFKLVPVPGTRQALARGADQGWTKVPAISYATLLTKPASNPAFRAAATVTAAGTRPGLYSARALKFPGDTSLGLTVGGGAPYFWTNSTGSTSTLELRTEYCDAAARRLVIEAICGSKYKYCMYGDAELNQCDNSGGPGGTTTSVTGTPGA